MRLVHIFVLTMALVAPALAQPVSYALDLRQSRVAFYYVVNGYQKRGFFPVVRAETRVDLQDVRRSTLDVTISTRRVQAADPLGTFGLRTEAMLATGRFPEARFVSTQVVPNERGGWITGDLTLKGVTRPVTLYALFQRPSDAPADNSELILQLSGAVSRNAFGVSGFAGQVEDRIALRFQVHLRRE